MPVHSLLEVRLLFLLQLGSARELRGLAVELRKVSVVVMADGHRSSGEGNLVDFAGHGERLDGVPERVLRLAALSLVQRVGLGPLDLDVGDLHVHQLPLQGAVRPGGLGDVHGFADGSQDVVVERSLASCVDRALAGDRRFACDGLALFALAGSQHPS